MFAGCVQTFAAPVCLQDVYKRLLPLYFPRCIREEEESISRLPKDLGNENGEPVIQERQIRILDKPTFAAFSKSIFSHHVMNAVVTFDRIFVCDAKGPWQ